MGRRIKTRWARPREKRRPALIVEREEEIINRRVFGDRPDLTQLVARLEKDGLAAGESVPAPMPALLRRVGGGNYGRRDQAYWIRVWAVPLGGMNYAIYRQIAANRRNSCQRIMRVGLATCPGLRGDQYRSGI